MIETLCACGAAIHAAESAVGGAVPCKSCGKSVRIAAAEAITEETSLGDFDARFVLTGGPGVPGETIALGGTGDIEIGKMAGRHIVLPGTLVSRAHCKLVRVDFGPSRWKIVDTNSRNGILVNGRKVAEAELKAGDTLRVGEFDLRYTVGFPPAPKVAQAPKAVGPACPGCGVSYPASTLICMTCGINLKTGKALVTSKHIDENDIAIRADTWIRIISLFVWFGLFPIASEAFATHKPRATWAITILTVVVSAIFLVAVIGNDGPGNLRNYMLWAGTPRASEARASDVDREFEKALDQQIQNNKANGNRDTINNEQLKMLRAELRRAAGETPEEQGEFHWYQLLTHALLHGGIMHLAGNLLFLLVFGLRVNELIGDLKMAVVYPLLAVCSGGIYAIAVQHQPLHPMLGASGAIMGLAGMYFIFFPVHKVHMAIWIRGGILTGWRVRYKLFQMKGFWLLVLWVGLNDVLPTVLGGRGDSVAHWAHLGGFMSGALIAIALLVSRQVDAHGADIFSVTLGPKAWSFIGKPGSRSALVPPGPGVAVMRYPV